MLLKAAAMQEKLRNFKSTESWDAVRSFLSRAEMRTKREALLKANENY